jgi:hypothetical protein
MNLPGQRRISEFGEMERKDRKGGIPVGFVSSLI